MAKLPCSPCLEHICAVITTFRPDQTFPERLSILLAQVGQAIVVNDSGSEAIKANLTKILNVHNITLIHNLKNVGLPASLNAGIRMAEQLGYTWILTLDDDSMVYADMVSRLCAYWKQFSASKPLGLMGMSWTNPLLNKYLSRGTSKILFSEKRGIITSGSLFSIITYHQIGPFREDFFIDSVDYDYGLRARKKGLAVVRVNETGFSHFIGNCSVKSILGYPIMIENHKPFRLYYWFRNTSRLGLEYLLSDPLYSMAVLWGQIKRAGKILLFETERSSKMKFIFLAYRDFILGRKGRVHPPS